MADETGKDDGAEQGMIDDISSELRDWAFIVDETIGKAHVVMLSGLVFSKAADEIERLRAVLDAIDALHQPDYKYPDECTECDFAWPCDTNLLIHSQEARRG